MAQETEKEYLERKQRERENENATDPNEPPAPPKEG